MRRLGVIALGALLGGTPTLAVAGGRDAKPPNGVSLLRQRQAAGHTPTTATSPLALLAAPVVLPEPTPTATLTVTTAADVVDPGDGKLSLREAVAQANTTPGTTRSTSPRRSKARRWC